MGQTMIAAVFLAVVACSQPSTPLPIPVLLGADVARVGLVAIPPLLVARVAVATAIAPRRALDRLVDDSLAAEGARRRGLDRLPAVEWATEVALARALSERLRDEAVASGPPSPDELARLRVVHAVIRRSPSLSRQVAAAAADALRRAVDGARDEADFERRAKAALLVVAAMVEELPEFDASGKLDPGGELDPMFVDAAFALRHPGETSSVLETPFGWHVLRLVARNVPEASSALTRNHSLWDAVLWLRTRARIDGLLRSRRMRLSVDIEAEADQRMAAVFPKTP